MGNLPGARRSAFAGAALMFGAAVALSGCAEVEKRLSVETPQIPRPIAAPTGAAGRVSGPLKPAGGQAVTPGGTGRTLTHAEIVHGSHTPVVPGHAGLAHAVQSGEKVGLNFVNAGLVEVADVILSQSLGMNYVIDPKVSGQVTMRTTKPIPKRELLGVLETILAMNNAALVLNDNLASIVPRDAAAGISGVAGLLGPQTQGRALYVIPLEHASAESIKSVAQSVLSPGRQIMVAPDRNYLMFIGSSREAQAVQDVVNVLDVSKMAGRSFGLFPLEVATAEEVTKELGTIFGVQKDGGPVQFLPITRMNAVLVITEDDSYLAEAQDWVHRLDRASTATGTAAQVYVYHVRNGRASELAGMLGAVFGGEAPPPPEKLPGVAPTLSSVSLGGSAGGSGSGLGSTGAGGTGMGSTGMASTGMGSTGLGSTGLGGTGLGGTTAAAAGSTGTRAGGTGAAGAGAVGGSVPAAGGAASAPAASSTPGQNVFSGKQNSELGGGGQAPRFIADERNNAIVMVATPAQYDLAKATLDRLDIVPLQVMIEVTIAEVTLDNNLKYGLQWFFEHGNFSAALSSTKTLMPSALLPGFNAIFDSANASSVLSALASLTDVKVVSSPQLMVLDNQTARLHVGDQVPVATQEATSITNPEAPLVNQIERIDTGVILEVTPRVNAAGLVTLDIVQDVSDAVKTDTSTLNSPTIQQRTIQTSVAVQSGATVALGGLISDRAENGNSGVPLVKDIPLLGNLFKTTSRSSNRTELLVLITPTVLRDTHEAVLVAQEMQKRLSGLHQLEKHSPL